MALSLSDIETLFARMDDHARDGDPVTRLDDAFPSASRTEESCASASVIRAALLYDVGRRWNVQGETPTLRGIGDLHQHAALPSRRDLVA